MSRYIMLCPLMCILLMLSCGTSKNTQKETNIDYTEQFQGVYNRMDSLRANMSLYRKETTEKLSNLKIENKTIHYSAPDSVGRQYPIMVSETKSEQDNKESSTTETELKAEVHKLTSEITDLKGAVKALVDEKSKVVEISWWDLYKIDIFFCAICIAVLWLIYKQKIK